MHRPRALLLHSRLLQPYSSACLQQVQDFDTSICLACSSATSSPGSRARSWRALGASCRGAMPCSSGVLSCGRLAFLKMMRGWASLFLADVPGALWQPVPISWSSCPLHGTKSSGVLLLLPYLPLHFSLPEWQRKSVHGSSAGSELLLSTFGLYTPRMLNQNRFLYGWCSYRDHWAHVMAQGGMLWPSADSGGKQF